MKFRVTIFLSFFGMTVPWAQTEWVVPDSNGVIFMDILSEIEKFNGLKFYYEPKDLPDGTWKIEDRAFQLAGANRFLDSFGLTVIDYNGYAMAIVNAEDWRKELTDQHLQMLRKISEEPIASLTIGNRQNPKLKEELNVTLKVIDSDNQQPVIGVTVSDIGGRQKYVTDLNGTVELKVKLGKLLLLTQRIGYADQIHKVSVFDDGQIFLEVFENTFTLNEIVVLANNRDEFAKSVQSGLAEISKRRIEEVPSFLGEPDAVKSLLDLPGISSSGEGTPGYHVRGGAVNQNLILLDEMLLFSSTHLFGMFGAIQSESLQGVQLYKGSMPAQYGGRNASTLLLDLKTAAKDAFKVNGGISPIATKFSVEVPLIDNRTSLLVGGRSTYSNWVLDRINVPEVKSSRAAFSDANFRLHHKWSDKSSLLISAYRSIDDFRFSDEFEFDYGTVGISAQWFKTLSPKWSTVSTLAIGSYKSRLENILDRGRSNTDQEIKYAKAKSYTVWQMKDHLELNMGLEAIRYQMNHLNELPHSSGDRQIQFRGTSDGLEASLFAEGICSVHDQLTFSGGLRFSQYWQFGPGIQYFYQNETSPSWSEVVDSVAFTKNSRMYGYSTIEPRLSLRLNLSAAHSIVLSYAQTAQYLHQISNRDVPLQTDLWTLSSRYVRPSRSKNCSLSHKFTTGNRDWQSNLSLFYMSISNITLSRDFSELGLTRPLETETLVANGRSYGVEGQIKKQLGALIGDITYTYSRSLRRTPNANPLITLSGGDWFPANYDTPHRFVTTLIYRINNRHQLATRFVYQSGRPLTGPTGFFDANDFVRLPVYSERNALRIPDYHRLDITYTLSQKHRRRKKWRHHWSLGIYNLYGRRNAFSIFFEQKVNSNIEGRRLSVLGSAFPYISYNFSFQNRGTD